MIIRIIKKSAPAFYFTILAELIGCASMNSPVYRYAGDENRPQSEEQKAESEAILKILESIHGALLRSDLAVLTEYVDKERGLYIDLKAHKSIEEVSGQIKDENSYLNIFFLNTRKLRETTGDKNQISIKDILKGQNSIQVELYFNEKNTECEAKLILHKKESLNYRLNNPYFIKSKNKWYIFRLM